MMKELPPTYMQIKVEFSHQANRAVEKKFEMKS